MEDHFEDTGANSIEASPATDTISSSFAPDAPESLAPFAILIIALMCMKVEEVVTSLELRIHRMNALKAQRWLEPTTEIVEPGRGDGTVPRGNLVNNLALFFGAAVILLLLGWTTFSYLKRRSTSWKNTNIMDDTELLDEKEEGFDEALDDFHVRKIVDLEEEDDDDEEEDDDDDEEEEEEEEIVEENDDSTEEETVKQDEDPKEEETAEETVEQDDDSTEEETVKQDEDSKEEETVEETVEQDDDSTEEETVKQDEDSKEEETAEETVEQDDDSTEEETVKQDEDPKEEETAEETVEQDDDSTEEETVKQDEDSKEEETRRRQSNRMKTPSGGGDSRRTVEQDDDSTEEETVKQDEDSKEEETVEETVEQEEDSEEKETVDNDDYFTDEERVEQNEDSTEEETIEEYEEDSEEEKEGEKEKPEDEDDHDEFLEILGQFMNDSTASSEFPRPSLVCGRRRNDVLEAVLAMRWEMDRLARENEKLQKERLDHLNLTEELQNKKDIEMNNIRTEFESLAGENSKLNDALLECKRRERELECQVRKLTEEVENLEETRTGKKEQVPSEVQGVTEVAELQNIIDKQADLISRLKKKLLEMEEERRQQESDFQEWERTVYTVRNENSELKVALKEINHKNELFRIFEERNKVLEEETKRLRREMADKESKEKKEKSLISKEMETLRRQMTQAFLVRDEMRNEKESMARHILTLERENEDCKRDVAYFQEWFAKDYANHSEEVEDCLSKLFEASDRHQLHLKEKLQRLRNARDSNDN
ncbi:probable serine/threonine-protein kinase kinX [Macrobrachium nipponense]|uniref:probable serine/threonine-protein kinase kinX n=1 Tax=Macrobrachium nipponense TaxID=159736 RepID=UPI0030C8D112